MDVPRFGERGCGKGGVNGIFPIRKQTGSIVKVKVKVKVRECPVSGRRGYRTGSPGHPVPRLLAGERRILDKYRCKPF